VTTALAYFLGFISWEQEGGAWEKPLSNTPGMDMLNAYQCRKGETKYIVLGGIEDNFSSEGSEIVELNNIHVERNRRANLEQEIPFRDYDEGGFDQSLIDIFDIPALTAHGLFVTRINPLSDLKNDAIAWGDLLNDRAQANSYSMNWEPEHILPGWKFEEGLLSTELSYMNYLRVDVQKDFETLLEHIRSGETETQIAVSISDDTVVDFIGFAVCTEPADHKGTTYVSGIYEMPDDVVAFACQNSDETYCDAYAGDTLCSTELPILCFNDLQKEKPVYDRVNPFSGSEHVFETQWTGGEMKLSTPVKGNQFATADDANEYCRSQFGSEWRTASLHENFSGYIVGFGSAPKYTRAWINVKDGAYGSCWDHRPEYEVANQ